MITNNKEEILASATFWEETAKGRYKFHVVGVKESGQFSSEKQPEDFTSEQKDIFPQLLAQSLYMGVVFR